MHVFYIHPLCYAGHAISLAGGSHHLDINGQFMPKDIFNTCSGAKRSIITDQKS